MNFLKKIPFGIYLICIWGLSILLVNPLGNFPLNDDWAYAQSVWNLCEHGKLTINNWPAMTLIGQVLWGTLFCKLFGFSFVILRISTLIASFIGAFTFYKLIQFFSSSKNIAAFTTILVFFNPLFFSLSFTFMTDVHFLTSMLLSLYFYIKYLQKRELRFIVFATIFSVYSTMIRQPGIIVPVAYALTVIFAKRRLPDLIKAFIPFIVTLIFLIGHSFWLRYQFGNPLNVAKFSDLTKLLSSLKIVTFNIRISSLLLFSGLFLFPLLVLFWNEIKNVVIKLKWISLIITILSIWFLIAWGVFFPDGNILYNLGLGPKLLKDSYWNQNLSPHLNYKTWIVGLKVFSITASVALILLLIGKIPSLMKRIRDKDFQHIDLAKLCMLFTVIAYVILLVINSSYFDRYSIPLFIILALLIMPYKMMFSKVGTAIAIVGLFIIILFSIGATHDYMSWNRSRWNAINYLTDTKKIKPTEIDGGFEFNAWNNTGPFREIKNEGKSWWWIGNDEYVISFGDITGFYKIKGFYFSQMLSSKNDSIYILQKTKVP